MIKKKNNSKAVHPLVKNNANFVKNMNLFTWLLKHKILFEPYPQYITTETLSKELPVLVTKQLQDEMDHPVNVVATTSLACLYADAKVHACTCMPELFEKVVGHVTRDLAGLD